MKRLIAALLASIALVLSGCMNNQYVTDQYVLADTETRGLAIFSFTTSGAHATQYSTIYLQPAETERQGFGKQARFTISSVMGLTDFGDFGGKPIGRVFGVLLEPGDYEFDSWMSMLGSVKRRSTAPIGVDFSVEAGRAVYVGSIDLEFLSAGRYRMRVSNARERDLPVFFQKAPKVSEDQIAVRLMR